MPFVTNFRYALLTYAQCGSLDEWSIVHHFGALGAECIVGREDHADGGTHLHTFVDFGRKFRSRRTDAFDVDGFHPNIVPSRGRPWGGWDYATKDGNIVAGGLPRPSQPAAVRDGDSWGQIVCAESESEFWELLEALAPEKLCTSYPALRKFADWRFAVETVRYTPDDSIHFQLGGIPALDAWRGSSLGDSTVGECCPVISWCRSLAARAGVVRGCEAWVVNPHSRPS